MPEIRFDFNNMLSSSIGGENGVVISDLENLSGALNDARAHLAKVLSEPESRVRLGLEWAVLHTQEKAELLQIKKLADEITGRFDSVLILGIGGSYLGLKAAQDALAPAYYNEFSSLRKRRPKIYFEGNNLDPDTLSVLLKNLKPRKTFVIVISKSGETTETKAAFMAVEKWLQAGAGKNYGRQIAAITDPESGSLRKRVREAQKKDKLSFRSLPLLKGVGGRYSEFNMGLLHLAIIGVDIQKVLDGAKAMAQRCQEPDVFKNPAYMYAALHHILHKQKQKSIAILMPFSEGLKSTADWYVQLLAESLGKKYERKIIPAKAGLEEWEKDPSKAVNTGRTPVSARGTNDLHSIQQNNVEGENNKVITFIRVERFKSELKIPGKNDILSGKRYSELIKLAQEATEWALVREGRPNCCLILPELSPYHWGGLLFFFEMATAFEGELLNVNAFDQPGVEGYKNYMYYKLNKQGMPEGISEAIKSHPLVKEEKSIL